MTLNPSNSSNLEQLALKGLRSNSICFDCCGFVVQQSCNNRTTVERSGDGALAETATVLCMRCAVWLNNSQCFVTAFTSEEAQRCGTIYMQFNITSSSDQCK